MADKIKRLFMAFILLALLIPVSASALEMDKIRTLFLNKDYSACIREGERLLAGSGRNQKGLDELYYYLGLSYLKEGNFLKSSDIFEIILNELKSSSYKEQALLGLGDSYLFQQEFVKAKKFYNDLLSEYPNTELKPSVYYRLSQIAKAEQDTSKTEFYLSKLRKEFPHSPEAKTSNDILTQRSFKRTEDIKPKVLSKTGFNVQVGAFSNRKNADNLAMRLEAKGFNISVVDSTSNGKPIYKVRAGPFSTESQAKDSQARLKTLGFPTKIVP